MERFYIATAPLHLGLGFSFFSYAGELTLSCVSDKETVPDPQAIVDRVRDALVEYCELGAPAPE